MKIYDVLREDHEDMLAMLDEMINLCATGHPEKMVEQVSTLKNRHDEHAQAEEGIFYPVIDGQPDVGDLIQRARAEHEAIESSLTRLPRLSDPAQQRVELSTLRDHFVAHVRLEEDEIFEHAEEFLSADDAENLGREIVKAEPTAHPMQATLYRPYDGGHETAARMPRSH